MSSDNPYYRELKESRDKDTDYVKKYLMGSWTGIKTQPLSTERLAVLSSGPRKAEFVTLEETVSMAYELMEIRRVRSELTPPAIMKHPDETDAEFKARVEPLGDVAMMFSKGQRLNYKLEDVRHGDQHFLVVVVNPIPDEDGMVQVKRLVFGGTAWVHPRNLSTV